MLASPESLGPGALLPKALVNPFLPLSSPLGAGMETLRAGRVAEGRAGHGRECVCFWPRSCPGLLAPDGFPG